MQRGAILTAPNLLSFSRFGLAALFAAAEGAAARVLIVAVASATDFLDGWLARRSKTVSRWGMLLDPLADRAFVFTAVCTFLFRGELTTLEYFVFLSRDIMTGVGFLVARAVPWLRRVTLRARLPGKIVTGLQLVVLFAVILAPQAVDALIVAVGVASAAAIADYTLMLWRERARA
jgi:cardiolipin synthase (CMP-forming)